MNRNDKILCRIDSHGVGLEIGPSFNPVAPRAKGFNVRILDVFSTDHLIDLNKNRGFDISKIEEVDYLWDGRPFTEVIGDHECFDWIIASHVIEHTVDFISFINDCCKLLKKNGVLSLVIPDKRFCFDIFRQPSSLAQIIDAYLQKRTKHTPGSIADYFLNHTYKNGILAWEKDYTGEFSFPHGYEFTKKMIHDSVSTDSYIDIHNWCFTPSSFRLILLDIYNLDFISMKEAIFFDTCGHEFYLTLSNDNNISSMTRNELLKSLFAELSLSGQLD